MTDAKPRRWTIKGGVCDTTIMTYCDGPVPELNERIEVIEASAYDALEARIAELEAALIRIRDMTPPVGQSFGPYDAENIAYVADDALNEKGKAK